MRPVVSAIVVNWNGEHVLRGCLRSLKNQSYKDIEVIVIDNGSKDQSWRMVQDILPDAKLLCLPSNEGFAAANNRGFAIAQGDYIALLNNDARADRKWLSTLIRAAEHCPEYGMYASKVLRIDGTIDSAGCDVYKDGNGTCRGRGDSPDKHSCVQDVDFPSGCAALYRRQMINQVGFFDERFFMYNEDTDLGIRAQKAGWKCLYVPTAKVDHLYSRSSSPYSLRKLFYVERNRLLILMKHYSFLDAVTTIPWTANRYGRLLWDSARSTQKAA